MMSFTRRKCFFYTNTCIVPYPNTWHSISFQGESTNTRNVLFINESKDNPIDKNIASEDDKPVHESRNLIYGCYKFLMKVNDMAEILPVMTSNGGTRILIGLMGW